MGNLMHEELPQQNRAECADCNGQLRLVTTLAPALGEPGHRIFQCEKCGRRVWITEPSATRRDAVSRTGALRAHREGRHPAPAVRAAARGLAPPER
jgi:hypothetical protein